jgi:hypothetical protein
MRFLIRFLAVSIGAVAGASPIQAQEEIGPAGRRIVGGEKTDIKQHPWQVALDITIDNLDYLCGGSLGADRCPLLQTNDHAR